MTKTALEHYRKADICTSQADNLVDIRNIAVDQSLPLDARIERFVTQVGNPYLFKVGDVAVKVECVGQKKLSDALVSVFASG